MSDLSNDTAVEPCGEGHYSARLSRDWEIWGPMGGYVAAVALRAAGASSPFARPVSFFCHYLNVADFDRVDLEVTTLRSGRTAMAQRVSVTQANRPVLEASIWSVGSAEGLEHDVSSSEGPRAGRVALQRGVGARPTASFSFLAERRVAARALPDRLASGRTVTT